MEQNILKIEINSLTDYIREIEKISLQSYFRGEDMGYTTQTSCAFRKYTGSWQSPKPYPFIKMIDEFYKETAYKLNDDKIDFIAFAQHYGIPTNLLDITSSPLTALYFACQGDENKKGYVYTMSKACINVTELIHKYPNQNLIDKVFSNTTNELKQLIPLFIEFNEKYPKEFYNLLDILIDEYLIYFKNPWNEDEKNFQNLLSKQRSTLRDKNSNVIDLVTDLIYFMDNLIDDFDKLDFEHYDYITLYLCLQFLFFKHAKDYKETIFNINFLPNMIYDPVTKFERKRNQHGLFIYQGYLNYIEGAYNSYILLKQKLFFNSTIYGIKNKKYILKSLDKIDINKKTLFCDFDNIAAYIKEKYSEK